jgi:hypothetical protein
MLFRYDMLNVVNDFAVLLAQQAIFALVSCAPPNGIAQAGIHC